jgi:hypothetical protein
MKYGLFMLLEIPFTLGSGKVFAMLSDRGIVTKEKLITMLDSTLIPSLNGVELQRSSVSDFQYRLASKSPNIAELYHENSKLSKYLDRCVITDEETIRFVKEWYLSTTCKISEEDIAEGKGQSFLRNINSVPDQLQTIFRSLESDQEAELLYSLDVLMLYENKVYRYIPLSDHLWLEKKENSDALNELRAMVIGAERDSIDKASAIIFLVGCSWRNMIFYGPRGYRNTVLDAGFLTHHFLQIAKDSRFSLQVFQNFFDRKVDNFLNLDGVERFTLMLIAVLDGNREG